MAKLSGPFREFLIALIEPWGVLWLGIGGSVIVLTVLGAAVSTHSGFEHAGILLQMLGIFTAVLGLEERRRAFGGRGFLQWGKEKLRKICGRPKSVRITPNPATSTASAGNVRVVTGLPQNAKLEEKIEVLQKNINEQDKKISDLDSKTQNLITQTKKDLQHEVNQSRNEIQKIHSFVEKVETGGIHVEIAGLIWLGAGLLCSAYPETAFYIFNFNL